MAIFRKSRRPRAADAPPPADPPAPSGGPREMLCERLREIADQAAAPEDALEPALHAILDAIRVQVGAVCLFDPRHGVLRLAAERGLSDEGCHRLRQVRRGDPTAWDMPLHGLLNRRAYLIESASRNRYVPRLVDDFAAVRTVACVPLYAGQTPVGSLVMLALPPRSLGEQDVRALERPLAELARLIERLRRRGPVAEPEPIAPRPTVDVATLIAERDQLRTESDAWLTERAALTAEVETRSAETERFRAALADATQVRAELERIRKADGVDRDRLRQALADATAERDRLDAALDVARRAASEARATEAERDAGSRAEVEELRRRVESAEADVSREATRARDHEAERDRLVGELRRAVAREQRLRDELHAATQSAAAPAEDLRRALESAHVAEASRAAAVASATELRDRLATAEAVIESLEAEASGAHAELERLHVAGAVQETAAGEADERERRATSAAADLERKLATADRQHEAASAALLAERDRLVALLAEESAERGRIQAALDRAESALVELGETLSRRDAELAEQTAEVERLRSEAPSVVLEMEPVAEPPATARDTVRVVTVAPTPAPAPRARVRSIESERRLVTVIDADPAWGDVALDGHQVAVLAPGVDAPAELGELAPVRIVVNLCATGALDTITALRAAGSEARVWGCLADASANRAIALSMIDASPRPLDPDAILQALGRYAVAGTRIVTAGADVDALMSLRQALARAGLSVSMAWDAKQAADLLEVVRPEVVIVELGLPRRDGYGIVARLPGCDPLPTAVLVPAAEEPSAGFVAGLGDPALAERVVALDQLLATVVGRSEAPPVERRPQRVRVAGRK